MSVSSALISSESNVYIVVIKLQAKLIVNIWNLFLAITLYKWVLILGGKSIFKPDFMMSYYRV